MNVSFEKFKDCYTCLCEIDQYNILTGSFFNENSFNSINSTVYTQNVEDKMIIDSEITQNEDDEDIIFGKDYNMEKIMKIVNKTNIVIITELEEIINWPFFIKKFILNLDNIIFMSTEPIIQIGKHILLEFYHIFNKLLLKYSLGKDTIIPIVSDEEIETFLGKIIKLNFRQNFLISPELKITLVSSGFSLGSSNIIIEFYDKSFAIISKSSDFNFRYPKNLDKESLQGLDFLILFPNLLNFASNYPNQIAKLTSEIYQIVSNRSVKSDKYPSIYMPTFYLFMLEFVDIFRYKVPKEVQNIYISKSIKSILEYANVSHGYINDLIHNKIYEFKYPFNFDELIKNNSFFSYEDFESFLKCFNTDRADSPCIFMVNNISYQFSHAKEIFENLIKNSEFANDAIIHLRKDVKIPFDNKMHKVKFLEFELDFRLETDQLENILFDKKVGIKPNKIYFLGDYEKEVYFSKKIVNLLKSNNIQQQTYNISEQFFVPLSVNSFSNKDNALFYQNSYFIGGSQDSYDKLTFGISNTKLSQEDLICEMKILNENENFFVSDIQLIPGTKTNRFQPELLEEELNKILKFNYMKISELLLFEGKINISIQKNITPNITSDSMIILETEKSINEDNWILSDVKINCDNSEDSLFLNKIVSELF
jgi:hypothetical protein